MKEIIENQSHQSYLDAPGVSSGMIKLCHQKSAYHVWSAYVDPEREDEGTESMDWGRALHEKFLLGDQSFDDHFILVETLDRRTKEGKAKWADYEQQAAATGKTLIRQSEELTQMEKQVEALRSNKLVQERMEGTQRELSCYSGDKKCRFDAVGGEKRLASDVKTIYEITRHRINAAVANFGYHIQAAWYLKVAEELEMDIHYDRFGLTFVESKKPYDVCVALISNDAIERGRDIVDRYYPEIQACRETGIWPGFGGQEVVANIPLYAYTDDE